MALPNATVHLHQVMGGAEGQASDIEIQARETLRLQSILRNILTETTGQTMKQIEKDTDRDFWLDAEAAKKYGLIDRILEKEETNSGSD